MFKPNQSNAMKHLLAQMGDNLENTESINQKTLQKINYVSLYDTSHAILYTRFTNCILCKNAILEKPSKKHL